MNATTTQTRHITLDALRGFAVMGILWMNITTFGFPEMAYISPIISTPGSFSDIAAWTGSFIFFDGKMRAIFSLLFGASMMLVIERATVSGQSPAKVHYSRMFWLAIFGLCHFYLLWWGDILFLYAVSGAVAYLFRNWSGEKLIKGGVLAYIISSVLLAIGMGTMFFLQSEAAQPNASQEIIDEFATMMEEFGISAQSLAEETALYQGAFSQILIDKLTNQVLTPVKNLFLGPFETIPLMMIGMGLYKSGFLLGQANRQTYVRIGVWGTLIGGLTFAALAWLAANQGFEIIIMMNVTQAWSSLPRLLMAIGYIGLLMLLIQRFAAHPLLHRVAAAGRVAFSNYLGASVVMAFLFYGWGLGLFGTVGRAQMILLVLSSWITMLLWSKPWLMRYRYGPLEWTWRSLARRERQPMTISTT
ncbi:DUF418 domain-containing protein [Parasphingorhabdus cellanae]|uniref:DUF418 domain-containing protein n=1 Tax=Parasphingorhabdus cellanae TaxID=2806553 RepID=A0ABX7T437_9SPHN|nr:DUF418 domain-containing protein [Parasphingorhabdus cellanae]QTD55698.1 DUF418 domain-containing protein [Parasphingorhabdus cellanae]